MVSHPGSGFPAGTQSPPRVHHSTWRRVRGSPSASAANTDIRVVRTTGWPRFERVQLSYRDGPLAGAIPAVTTRVDVANLPQWRARFPGHAADMLLNYLKVAEDVTAPSLEPPQRLAAAACYWGGPCASRGIVSCSALGDSVLTPAACQPVRSLQRIELSPMVRFLLGPQDRA